MAKRTIAFAFQDGPDFYICSDESGDEVTRTVSYPKTVGLDLRLALKARQWFHNLMLDGGFEIKWINPYAPKPTPSRVTNMVDMSGYTGDDLEF